MSKSYHITPKGRLVTIEKKRGTGLQNQAGKRTTRVGRETSIKGKTKRPTQSKLNRETNQDHNAQEAINTNSTRSLKRPTEASTETGFTQIQRQTRVSIKPRQTMAKMPSEAKSQVDAKLQMKRPTKASPRTWEAKQSPRITKMKKLTAVEET